MSVHFSFFISSLERKKKTKMSSFKALAGKKRNRDVESSGESSSLTTMESVKKINRVLCISPGCEKNPSFGLKGSKKAVYCATHKNELPEEERIKYMNVCQKLCT